MTERRTPNLREKKTKLKKKLMCACKHEPVQYKIVDWRIKKDKT